MGLTIVMYHSVCEQPDEYAISPLAFARQIDFLKRRYRIIRLKDVRSALESNVKGDRSVVVTFDDAFSDFLHFADPVLRRAAIPCSVFVPTACIGRTNGWDARSGQGPVRDVMSADDISKLHSGGLVDFGSHTVDHVSMADVPQDEMRRQAIESKRELETLLHIPITTFAYPYGQLDNFSKTTTRILAETGYEFAVTTHWGTHNSVNALLTLKRIHFREADTDGILRSKIEGDYNWVAAKEKLGFALRWARNRFDPPLIRRNPPT